MIGELAAIAGAFCFAIAAIIYRSPLRFTSAASASVVRFVGTGLILTAVTVLVVGIDHLLALPMHALLLAATSGIVGLTFGDVLYMSSFKTAGIARTVSVVATYPMFSLLIEYIIGRGAPPLFAALGAVLIFVGVWLLTRSADQNEETFSAEGIKRGIAAALGTAFLYSISMLFFDASLDTLAAGDLGGAFAVNSLRTASGGGFLLLCVPLIDRQLGFLRMQKRNIALLLVGSIVAYGIGWYLLTLAFILAPTAFVVPLSSITPLFATFFAVLLLREPLPKKGILGVLLTVAGALVIVIG